MARMTYVNWGLKSGNKAAMQTSMDIMNGDKSLEFGGLGEGHYGHAGVNDDVITLNSSAIDISKDTMGKAGAFTSVMAREGYLIGRNQELGVEDYLDQEMRENGLGKQLTREAVNLQNGVMSDIAKNMGVKFEGEWGAMQHQVGYAATTGDVSGFDTTGRDNLVKGLTDIFPYYKTFVNINDALGPLGQTPVGIVIASAAVLAGTLLEPLFDSVTESQRKAFFKSKWPEMFAKSDGEDDAIESFAGDDKRRTLFLTVGYKQVDLRKDKLNSYCGYYRYQVVNTREPDGYIGPMDDEKDFDAARESVSDDLRGLHVKANKYLNVELQLRTQFAYDSYVNNGKKIYNPMLTKNLDNFIQKSNDTLTKKDFLRLVVKDFKSGRGKYDWRKSFRKFDYFGINKIVSNLYK